MLFLFPIAHWGLYYIYVMFQIMYFPYFTFMKQWLTANLNHYELGPVTPIYARLGMKDFDTYTERHPEKIRTIQTFTMSGPLGDPGFCTALVVKYDALCNTVRPRQMATILQAYCQLHFLDEFLFHLLWICF